MKLERCSHYQEEFYCELTRELDSLAGLKIRKNYDYFHHYILANDWCKEKKCLAIRVPGGTVGAVWIGDDNVIKKIAVDTNYVIKTYPSNVNKLIQKFVGEVIAMEDFYEKEKKN